MVYNEYGCILPENKNEGSINMRRKKLTAVMLGCVLAFTTIGTPMTAWGTGKKVAKSMELNVKSKETMYVGMSKKIQVKKVTPKGASGKFILQSSNPLVVKVRKNGNIKAVNVGVTTVTVALTGNPKVNKKIKVTVKKLIKNNTDDKIALPIAKKKVKLEASDKKMLSGMKFSSDKKGIATVSKKGVITAKRTGVAKITVQGKRGKVKGAKQILTVYVTKQAVKKVKLDLKNVELNVRDTQQLQVTVEPEGACDRFFYASSDEQVATVDAGGLITAKAKGTAKITVTTLDGGKKAVCTVIVSEGCGNKETATPGETKTPAVTETKVPVAVETPAVTETKVPVAVETPAVTETKVPVAVETPAVTETKVPVAVETPEVTQTKTPEKTTLPGATGIPGDKDTEITYREPVTLQELEAKFPEEPNYPALDLADNYTQEVALKDDLLTLDVPAGTIVKTKGYYEVNDGGQAVYEIMTYDQWWAQLPIELKMVTYHVNRIGAGQVFYKNPADNYGNHRLKNGMVARILPNDDGYVRVEQWGLFPGRKDNNRALVHIFANNHKNSKILFAKNATYELYYDTKNQAYQNQNGIVKEVPWWLSLDSIGNNGNEYAVLLHSRGTSKPVIGDAKNVELCGNGATLRIPDEEFCKGNTADFAMIEMGGYVDGLKIHGFTFDNNGLNQHSYVKTDGTTSNMRTTNHAISYFSSGANVERDKVLTDGNGEKVLGEITFGEFVDSTKEEKTTFNNVEIYGNIFLANGTSISTNDCGGDDLLIINPDASENVNIHNNKMYNWGRWVLAVDLGGNGERFYNYTFKQNICIQEETNVCSLPANNYPLEGGTLEKTNALRGLGWIDFEARKCFTNLDVSENYVYGANGWAFNGNGKISENITIEANVLERASYEGKTWRGIYPYVFEFYSVYAKNLQVSNNKIGYGSIKFGNLAYNVRLENNDFGGASFGITRPMGSVIVKNNVGTGVRNQTYHINAPEDLPWIDDPNSDYYIPPKDRTTDILFENNGPGGMVTTILGTDNEDDYRNKISLIFKNNNFKKFDVNAFGLKEYYFTPDQLNNEALFNWAARGCKYGSKVDSRGVDNPVPGGLYYKPGDVVTDTLDKVTRLYNPYYFNILFPQLKNENGSIKKDMKIVCTKEGVFPLNGEFLCCEADSYFATEKEYNKGAYVYTADNLYYVTVAGKSGTSEPTHTSKTAANGTAEFMWIAPIARYEMQPK